MTWTRRKDITNFTPEQIKELLKDNPTLIGNTFTARQFFETDYEYDLTNCDIEGKPLIEECRDIEGWEDVKIVDKNGIERYLIYPYIYKCTDCTVYVLSDRLIRTD